MKSDLFLLFQICIGVVAVCCVSFTHTNSEENINVNHTEFQNVSQLITSQGYPVEEYHVETADGYILGLQRIPHGLPNGIHVAGEVRSERPVVFLQHGLIASAADWVINFRNQSLGYILADAGYDVWLGNVRGSTYSRAHRTLSPDQAEFWKFTWDEMSTYDLPAMIDFVLNKTRKSELNYIGHSQGTIIVFALLSEQPAYNDKIKAVLGLGPVATVGNIRSPIRYLAPFADNLEVVFELIGANEFLPNTKIMKFLADFVCGTRAKVICENAIFFLCGVDKEQLNVTRLPVYVSHSPAGTSTVNVVHFAQMVSSQKFQKYDFGKSENMEKYGQPTPPEYFVENITTPIALFWGLNDWLADPVDVLLLQLKIRHLITSYLVPFPKWAHLDYVWGLNANKLLYPEVMRVLKKVS